MKNEKKDIFKSFLDAEERRITIEYHKTKTRFKRLTKLRNELRIIKEAYGKKGKQ